MGSEKQSALDLQLQEDLEDAQYLATVRSTGGSAYRYLDAAIAEHAALRAEIARMRNALEELLAADHAWWWSSVGAHGNTDALVRMDDARRAAHSVLGGRDG